MILTLLGKTLLEFFRGKPFWRKPKTEKQVCFSVFSGVTVVTVTLFSPENILFQEGFSNRERVFAQLQESVKADNLR